MVVGNSANLAWGRENINQPGWSDSHLWAGDRVGVLLDARKRKIEEQCLGVKGKGGRLYFYFNGIRKPIAWDNITCERLCFCVSMHDWDTRISIVQNTSLPADLPELC